jgi:amino acid transporter
MDRTGSQTAEVRRDPSVLPRRIGVWSAAGAIVGLMIGSGIFRVPSVVAGSVDAVGAIALVWIAGGLLSLCGALSFGELAATYPEPGGVYVFLRETWGRLPAFLFGWTRLLVLTPATIGALALIFASYLGSVVGMTPATERWVAAAAIVALAALNYRSLLWSAVLENVTSLAKAVVLVGVALVAFVLYDGSAGALNEAPSLAVESVTGFGFALVTVMWTYSGWASMTSLSGEVKDPGRNIPLAQLWAVTTVMLIYLVVNAAYLWVLSVDEAAASTSIAADVMDRVLGAPGQVTVALLVMLATFSAANASLMFAPRCFFAMSMDGLFFKRVAAVHPRFKTPHVATVLTAAIALGYITFRGFEELVSAFVLGAWPFYVLAVAGLVRMRRLRPDLHRPYRVWGYPLVPMSYIGAGSAVLLAGFVAQPWTTVLGIGVVLSGLPVYVWLRRAHDV